MCNEVEVVDAPINYNLMLGRSWTYEIHIVVSTVFRVLLFPHEGRIVTIDQLSFSRPNPSSRASMVLMIDNPYPNVVNVGFGLCPPLMGTLYYLYPFVDVKFILVVPDHPRDEVFQVSSSERLNSMICGIFLPHQL
jgi:hypothetical protein